MAVTATFSTVSGVGDTPALNGLTVLHNSPNPFTHGTSFSYGLPAPADVHIEVYDAAGRRVYAESIPGVGAGWHNVRFEGIQRNGRVLPSGVYFYRVQALGNAVTRKMVIVR
jgi:flagellar hook assembly protein FlgD